jgi:hypothetical protein
MPRWLWICIGLIIFYNVFIKEDKKAPPTYYPAYTPSYPTSSGYKGSYGCTVDCSGHDAGYRWAEQNDIDDPDDCYGNSQSFIEGCREYAEDN